jgi:hypothetical protein
MAFILFCYRDYYLDTKTISATGILLHRLQRSIKYELQHKTWKENYGPKNQQHYFLKQLLHATQIVHNASRRAGLN